MKKIDFKKFIPLTMLISFYLIWGNVIWINTDTLYQFLFLIFTNIEIYRQYNYLFKNK